MKKYVLVLLFAFANVFAFGQAKQTISKFSVTYKVKHLGFSSSGKFDELTGDIHFDPEHPATSNITAFIDVNSFNSDNSMRDKDLKSDSYFDVAHYPKIIMKSVSFSHKDGNNYIGKFDLTIKGKTKQVELPFVYMVKGNSGNFEGSFSINRLDYNVGKSSMMLANDVIIIISLQTTISN